jgi:hypothetical protein
MKPLPQRISPLLRGALLVLLFLQVGCSVLLPDSDFRTTLVNRTDKPLIYSAMTSEVAAVVYMGYTFPVGPGSRESAAFVQPGESTTLTREEIMGEYEPGENVVFFLYEVNGDTATWKDTFAMTRKDLERRHFRLEITRLPMSSTR